MKILMKEEKLQNRLADWESIKNEMISCKNFSKAQEIDYKIKNVDRKLSKIDQDLTRIASDEIISKDSLSEKDQSLIELREKINSAR